MRAASGLRLASCVLLFVILQLGQAAASQEKAPLRILSLLTDPASQEALNNTASLLAIVRTAVKHVNERRGLLDGYELKVAAEDGGCDATTSTVRVSFVTQVFGRRGKDSGEVVGVVGPLCQESAQAVAELADRPQISINNIHLASSFSTDTNQRNFSFSMLGPASDLLAAIVAFTQHAGWKRIYVLYESQSLFYDQLYRNVLANVEGVVSETEVLGVSYDNMGTILDALSAIQSSGYRVIFLLTGEQLASHVLCVSDANGLTFPNYQFVLVGGSVPGIQSGMRKETCHFRFTGTLLIYHKTASLQTHPDYTSESESEAVSSAAFMGPLLYDSVWALALALNNSIETLENMGLTLADYRYGMPEASKIIEEELFQLQFRGVSGEIDFKRENGFSRRRVEVRQVVGGEKRGALFAEYSFGNFTVLTSNATWEIIEDSFPRWTPGIHIAWSVVFFMALFVHLTVLITVHMGLIVYRDQSWVKASSNRMNQFNIAGNYLLLLGLCLHNIIHTFIGKLGHKAIGVICHMIWPWVLSIGTTLVICSLALKTWRLYRIFVHYLNPGRVISDLVLSLFLSILVGIDVIIATIWTATDPITAKVESETITDRDGRIRIRQSIVCVSDSIQMWLVLIMLYKTLQIGLLLTLTLLTRKINNKKYTTLNLRIMSYTLSFTVGFGVTLFYFLFFTAGDTIADDIVLNLVVHSLVLQNILLVFLPPLIPALKERFKTSSGTYSTST